MKQPWIPLVLAKYSNRRCSPVIGGNWGFAVGALNAGMQILGGLSAIYTLGSSSVGLEFKGNGATLKLN